MKKDSCYDAEGGEGPKPRMARKTKGELSARPAGKTKGGKGMGHLLHHQNRPHGSKGPASPEGFH